MSINLTPGKIAGLKAMSDQRGVIAAAAMDQRGLLKKMLAKALGGAEPPLEMMQDFKRIVAGTLTRHASAILLDVEYGLTASKNINGKGLLLAYEKSGYDTTGPEKLPSLTEGWSVMRLKEAGADAIKILIYYNQYENEWVNEQKKAWLERIGQECIAMDMPLFLEFLAYDVHGENEAGLAYAKRKPEIVRYCTEEFTKDRYAADVLKVEPPVQMAFVSGTQAFKGEAAYTRDEAMELFRSTASYTDKPMVYLSAGTTSAVFIEMLELAAESGAEFHGVLGGRATWQDGAPIYATQGEAALQQWLDTVGTQNITNVNNVLKSARPWYEARGMKSA
ncbi:MAG TPA: tagatose 1,6-diphosphate aldolase [Acidobacteriaceae bacterium]